MRRAGRQTRRRPLAKNRPRKPFVGWNSKAMTSVEFYRCSQCEHLQEVIFGTDGMFECFGCHQHFHKEAFHAAKVQRAVVECRHCSVQVSLTPSNLALTGVGYICQSCNNFVAVRYGRQSVDPTVVLDLAWNPTLQARGEPVHNALQFIRCRTKKDLLVVRLMQVMAKEEDERFLFVREDEHTVGLYCDFSGGSYIGFILWTVTDGHAVLRQVFVAPEERRKGLAARLISFWVTHYADTVNATFGIESPNDKALRLHIKLGHAVRDGDSIRGVKCFFVGSV
jgi:GNAT superfamily N-acetyltransferase